VDAHYTDVDFVHLYVLAAIDAHWGRNRVISVAVLRRAIAYKS
jgi:hypothetical protein